MNVKNPRTWSMTLAALACASVQGWILRHELVDCLPFKEMPLASRYEAVADLAFLLGPVLAAFVASRILRITAGRRPVAVSLLASLVCPLFFLATFRLLTPAPAPDPQAPDFSTQAAWSSILWMAKATLIAGAIGSGALAGILGLVRNLGDPGAA